MRTLLVLATLIGLAGGAMAEDTIASSFGFDPEDATACLQAAIDAGTEKVVVPFMGAPWIVRPIKLRGNLELVFEPGVVVLAKEGEFKGKSDSLFSASNEKNITLRGYGATLRMRKADYQSDAYEKAEWRMTLALRGCTNLKIEGLRLESSGGDGIYIGCTSQQPWCENVVIRDVICHDHHRQGMSIIGAVNMLIENCVMSGTSGTAPQAGIDLEPNADNERLENCVIRNCVFEDNAGAGMEVYVRPMSSKTKPISVLFENCHVRSGRKTGIAVGAVKDDGPQGTIEFKNCTVENTQGSGAYVFDKSADSAHVRFVDCKFSNTGADGKMAPFHFTGNRPEVATSIGGIELIDCRVYDPNDRPMVRIQGKDGVTARDIKGTLLVNAPGEPHIDTAIPAEDIDLKLEQK